MPLLLLLLLASRLLPRARGARRAAIAVAAFAAAAAAGCAFGRSEPDAPLTPVRVTGVVDGDTIEVQTGGRRERVRLLGIDTPELRGSGGAECGAAAARANLRRLTRPGHGGAHVRLHTDPDSGDVRDRYGRLLAYTDGPHGDLGEAQLRAGLALVYRHRGRTFSRLARYLRAEAAARARRRGIWSACQRTGRTTDR
jgi:micrococcal nuclease